MLEFTSVTVGNGMNFAQLVAAANYSLIAPDVTDKHYRLAHSEPAVLQMTLLDAASLGQQVRTMELKRFIRKEGLRSANVGEMLAFGYQHSLLLPTAPEGLLSVVALDAKSRARDKDGYNVLTIVTHRSNLCCKTLTCRRYNATPWYTPIYRFLCVPL